MNIAIVNQHFHTGGVETFLLSLIPQFLQLGHRVELRLLQPDAPNALLPQLRALGVAASGLAAPAAGGGRHRHDIALVTNPATLFAALRPPGAGGLPCERFVVGVYQTRMFCLDRGPLNLHNRLTRQLFARVPPANVIFGNHACRAEHAQHLPAMAGAPVVPLIVDGARFARRPALRRSTALKIVSIGRLEPFKTYNLTLLPVIDRLRRAGHDVAWHVHGSGPLRPQMLRLAAELGIADRVHLHGDLDYQAMPAALADAFAFVGSGMAMMEAAACGVPALPAIEYCAAPQTFGFVQDIPGISFFEPGLALPRHDIGDLLLQLLQQPAGLREACGDAGRARMADFSPAAVAQAYIQAFRAASTDRPAPGALAQAVYQASARLHRSGRAGLQRLGWRGG